MRARLHGAWRSLRRGLPGLLFVSPWLVGFLVFTAGPFLTSIYLSFTRYNIVSAPRWVGVENYAVLVTDPVFWHSLELTLLYAALASPLAVVAGVALSLLLNFE